MRSRVAPAILLACMVAGCSAGDGGQDSGGPGDGSATTAARQTFPTRTTVVATTGLLTTVPPATTSVPTVAPSSTSSAPATQTPTSVPVGEISVRFEEVGGIEQPVAFAIRPGDAALYIASQAGRVFTIRDGAVQARPVLDVSARTSASGEQGLLGLAFSPDGSHAYVHYTAATGDGQIDEFAVGTDGTFDAASRRALLTVRHRDAANHNGGSVVIGPDGLLYLGFGDGGGGSDPNRAGQDAATLLGKILRIDPTPSGDAAYTIPGDNPFVGVEGVRPEIWAYGLRNPWRFSFDRATGDLWIGDLGQGDLEEVDVAFAIDGAGAGANFGWSAFEGSAPYNADQQAPGHQPPVYEYRHQEGNLAVTGGFVYRGSAIPALMGAYVFGDYGSGRIWALRLNDEDRPDVAPIGAVAGVASFGEDHNGELYALSVTDGKVFRIVAG